MSSERLLAIALLIGSVALVIRLGPSAVRSWRVYAGSSRRRQEDAVGRVVLVPPGVADRAAALAALGYHRLGETRLVLPTGIRFAWIVAADDAESYAILVDSARPDALTGLYSAWPDGTWLGTMHPRGDALDRAALHIRVVPSTLAEAVTRHRAEVERLKPSHGSPRPVRTMPDMLALDADYRTRFGGIELRPLLLRIVAPAVAAALLAVLSLALLIVVPR
jgi:hypothetical protein